MHLFHFLRMRNLAFGLALVLVPQFSQALPISGNVVIQPVLLNPTVGAPPAPNLAQDLSYASTIYSQIGLNVSFAKPITLTQNSPGGNGTWTPAQFNSNLNAGFNLNGQTATAYQTATHSAIPTTVIPVYYVPTLTGPFASTQSQEDVAAGKLPGIIVGGKPRVDTVAHEVGHVLLNTWRWRNGNAAEVGGVHSNNRNDLMAAGAIRNIPTSVNPAAPPVNTPAPLGNLDVIGIDAGGQNPSFGYINDKPGATPNSPKYVMPEVNAMYGASDAGGTAVNQQVSGVKTAKITLTVGNTALIGTPWGQTNTIQGSGPSGPSGDPLIVSETARIQKLATATAAGVEQFAFEYRDPTTFGGGGGMLSLSESGLQSVDPRSQYQGVVGGSLKVLDANYNPATKPGGLSAAPPVAPDNNAALNPINPAMYTASFTYSSVLSSVNWQLSIPYSAIAGNTDLFVEFSATVPEPTMLASPLVFAAVTLCRRARRV